MLKVKRQRKSKYEVNFQDRALIDQGLADRSTTVTVSVIVYYTVQFADITSDIPGFINGLIDQANAVYRNTKNIPIRLRLHCIQPSFIDEKSNMDILAMFRMSRGV